ncbi:MAG: N-acetylmuramoyl-L-alanine amidase [Stackebrandtia sp.]
MSGTRITRRHALIAVAAFGAAAVPLGAGKAFADTRAPKLYIDPGHGGSDSGAVGNGLEEKALTLDISLQVNHILTSNFDVETRMSRTDDATVSLDQRTSDANSWGANFFVSIHINSGGGTGFESYRHPSAGSDTVNAHNILHPAIMAKMGGVTDRGQKTANFHVLRETAMAAILTENLFIDTAADADRLKDPAFITAAAQGHADGIAQLMGL